MKNKLLIALIVLASGFQFSCEPDRAIYDDEVLITLASKQGNYYVKEENNDFTLPVWMLRPADQDISVTLLVNEAQSTAVEGEDFEIIEQTIIIPAGELTASFMISTEFGGASVEGETVFFELSSDDAELTEFSNNFQLNIKKACSLEPLPGVFNVNSEFWEDSFDIEVEAGDEQNVLILKDFYSAGADIRVIVNEDFSVDVPKQPAWVSGTYGQASLVSRAGSVIDPCNGILTLVLEHTVAAGSFGTTTEILTKQGDEPEEEGGSEGDGEETDGEETDGEETEE